MGLATCTIDDTHLCDYLWRLAWLVCLLTCLVLYRLYERFER